MKNYFRQSLTRLIVGIIFIILSSNANGAKHITQFAVKFTVVVDDSTLLKSTKLIFKVQQKGINTDLPGFLKEYPLSLLRHANTIVLPLSTVNNYLKIEERQNDLLMADRVFDESNGLFIVQNGDDITLHIGKKREQVHFTGIGSDKLNCQYQLGNQTTFSVVKYNQNIIAKNYQQAFESGRFQHDSIFRHQQQILNRFKLKISKPIYDLLYLDWQSYNHQRTAELFYVQFRMGHTEYLPTVNPMFDETYDETIKSLSNNSMLKLQSFRYADYCIAMVKMKIAIQLFRASHDFSLKYPFSLINSEIDKNIPIGKFKDKILLLAFISSDKKYQSDYFNYVDKAINTAVPGIFKDGLKAFYKSNKENSIAFPFDLSDTSGKRHSLIELTGKIVVLDFWFTGCHGCLELAPVLKSLAIKYKNNPNIAFVSISIDRSNASWKRSVTEGRYCSEDEINLIAENGKASKIIQYYNINSFPALIFISNKGRIITTSPPDPRLDLKKFESLLINSL